MWVQAALVPGRCARSPSGSGVYGPNRIGRPYSGNGGKNTCYAGNAERSGEAFGNLRTFVRVTWRK